jgi:hypothetical protein
MTEAETAAPSDILQPGTAPAASSTEPAKIKATFHFGQGVPVPESMKAGAVSNADAQHAVITNAFASMGVDQAVLEQRQQRMPISQMEFDLATNRLNILKADTAWQAKYFAGDAAAKKEFATLHIILGSTIKKDGK